MKTKQISFSSRGPFNNDDRASQPAVANITAKIHATRCLNITPKNLLANLFLKRMVLVGFWL